MLSKRRTFHVDWDSPSNETGTVKRRPASLNTSFPISNSCFENVEYYEVKDCIGGYGLRLLKSFDGRFERYQDAVPEFLASKRRPSEMEAGAIKDNGNGLKHPRSRAIPRKKGRRSENEDAEKSEDLSHSRGSSIEERIPAPEQIKGSCGDCCSSISKDCAGDRNGDEGIDSVSGDRNGSHRSRSIDKIEVTDVKETIDSSFELAEGNSADLLKRRTSKKNAKHNAKKDFGLKLSREPFQWKSRASRIAKVPGGSRKLDTVKTTSLIPKAKTTKCASNGRGLVNSSSESSGIGSPLSPLSPQKDASTNARTVPENSIRPSGSKSSGLGSPDSPLSPESQKYTAFYLIEEQLEKLRNCPCEKRQAEVNYVCIV